MPAKNEDFPEELIRPIKTLNDETRRKIVLALAKEDEVSYSEIQEEFNLKKGTLTHHLHHLVSSGLIRNLTMTIPESRHTSYYELTDFGYRFLDGLYYTLAQRPSKRTYTLNSITISDDYQPSGSATSGYVVIASDNAANTSGDAAEVVTKIPETIKVAWK